MQSVFINRMLTRGLFFWLLMVSLLPSFNTSLAWDAKGHRAVAAIAWAHMDPAIRTKAISILRSAPSDSDLLLEDQVSTLPQANKDRELFLRAATWPDIVRATQKPQRRSKYHKQPWHYVNLHWGTDSAGLAVERTNVPAKGDLLKELKNRAAVLSDSHAAAEDKAISLCWFEHLVGDSHQPLHASARITTTEPSGDLGGNTFCLGSTHPDGSHDCDKTLHGLWDKILTSNRSQDGVDAVASDLQHRFGKPLLLQLTDYELWARESLKIAMEDVYPATLSRRAKPNAQYFATALSKSEPRIALAGYRLGEALNSLLK